MKHNSPKPVPKVIVVDCGIKAQITLNDVVLFTDDDGHLEYPCDWNRVDFTAQADGYQKFTGSYPIGPGKNLIQIYLIPVRAAGIVHSAIHCLADADGMRNFLGATLFPAAILSDEELDKNCKFLAANKFDYIRVLCEVGGESWEDRTINPNTIDWSAFLNKIYTRYGLRVQFTIFGGLPFSDNPTRRTNLVLKIAQVAAANPEKVHFIEIANESYDNGPDFNELHGLVQLAQANTKNLVASSSPQNWQDDVNKLYNDVGSILTMHLERTNENNYWKYVRQPWAVPELANCPSVFSNNEGVGPYSSGVQDSDIRRLSMYAGVTWINGADFLLHNGAGIRCGGSYDINRGLPASWQETPGIQQIVDSINYVRSILPRDSANWTRANDGWSTPQHPFPSDAFWSDGADHGPDRNYSIQSGNSFFCLPSGILNYANLLARNNYHIKVHDPVLRKVVQELDIDVNQVFKLNGAVDTQSAYIIEGKVR